MKQAFLMLVVVLCASGCAFTNIQVPMDTNFDKTTLGDKEGRASSHTVLYLVSWGDAGTKAASKDGNIVQINHADRDIFSVLFGFYTRVTTVVYGE